MTKLQAIEELRTGNPSCKAFEVLGLPFEAFLRFGQVSKETRERALAVLIESME
jgi:hypothetical protein